MARHRVLAPGTGRLIRARRRRSGRIVSGMPLPRSLAAIVAAVLCGTSGCTSDEPAPSDADAGRPAVTSLADLDPAGMTARRAAFCDTIPDAAVADALGGRARRSSAWGNGDTVTLADGVRDVAHEFGCRHRARDGTVAEAWVFAPPVDRRTARGWVREAAEAQGCEPLPDAASLGSPSVALACEGGGEATASYRGLVGDGWLVCRIATGSPAPDDLAERADRWCAAALRAAAG